MNIAHSLKDNKFFSTFLSVNRIIAEKFWFYCILKVVLITERQYFKHRNLLFIVCLRFKIRHSLCNRYYIIEI